MTIAQDILASFGRIASADGGALALLDESASTIRLAYKPGAVADCADGVCALPHAELEAMIRDWLARKAPDMGLEIELSA